MPRSRTRNRKRFWPLDRRLVRYAKIFFIIEVVILLLVSSIPLTHSQYTYLNNIFNSVENLAVGKSLLASTINIFSHNLLIATLEFIPVFGLIVFGGSMAVTGLLVGAGAVNYGVPGIAVSLALFTLPDTWIELFAYALAAGEGIRLLTSQSGFRRELKAAIGVWLLVGALLASAAALEALAVALSSPYAFATWIPVLAVLAVIFLLRRRRAPRNPRRARSRARK